MGEAKVISEEQFTPRSKVPTTVGTLRTGLKSSMLPQTTEITVGKFIRTTVAVLRKYLFWEIVKSKIIVPDNKYKNQETFVCKNISGQAWRPHQ